MKFIHCADVHIEVPFSSLGDLAAERREDVKLAFEKVVSLAATDKADLLLISGDLCEQNYARKATLHFLNQQFSKIPSTEVFIIPGNHDIELFGRKQDFDWCCNVHILNSFCPSFFIERLNTCVYSTFGDYGNIDGRRNNILLYHGTVDMNFKDLYNPISSGDLASLGMSYVALGHFHNRIDNLASHGTLYNPGSLEPLGFDEEGQHGAYIGNISHNKLTDIKFHALAGKTYKNFTININDITNDEEISRLLQSLPDPANTLVNVILKGVGGLAIDESSIKKRLEGSSYFIKVSNETDDYQDIEKIKDQPGLKGAFVKIMLRRIEDATSDEQKRLLSNALYLGLEALTYGKINSISV